MLKWAGQATLDSQTAQITRLSSEVGQSRDTIDQLTADLQRSLAHAEQLQADLAQSRPHLDSLEHENQMLQRDLLERAREVEEATLNKEEWERIAQEEINGRELWQARCEGFEFETVSLKASLSSETQKRLTAEESCQSLESTLAELSIGREAETKRTIANLESQLSQQHEKTRLALIQLQTYEVSADAAPGNLRRPPHRSSRVN